MVDAERSRAALSTGLALSGLSAQDLAVRSAAIGDHVTPAKLTELLTTDAPRQDLEHDVVAIALNERLSDEGMDHPVPTSTQLAAVHQTTGDHP